MPADITNPETGEQITEYLSPSRVNSFIECPGEWALRYLYGMDSPDPTDKMTRGSLIEDYLNNHLKKSRMENPYYEDDLDIQSRITAKKLLKEMDVLFDKIKGELILQRQLTNFNFPLPMVGFTDYQIRGHLFELKTTTRKPMIKPSDNHLRQIMIYKGWHPNIENFELHSTCLIYGIMKKVPEVHFWISKDMEGYFDGDSEYSIISQEHVDSASISMKLAIPSMNHHLNFYKENGYTFVPMDFSHYRLRGYQPRECMKYMESKFRLFKDLENERGAT